jgi:ABC-type multidrug transport system ATPase subunit
MAFLTHIISLFQYHKYRNHVNVPADLKQSLQEQLRRIQEDEGGEELFTEEREVFGTHTEYIKDQQKKRRSSIAQIDAIAELENLLRQVKSRPPNFTLRIQDGSYAITNTIHTDPMAKPEVEGDVHSSGRAKQQIKTIRTESMLFKLRNLLVGCSKGQVRPKKETVVIMDQVNIALSPGKMYLVLGAPGCGKSTLLKMIANNLYTSPNHVFGGTVSISAVAANDPGIYWSNLVGYIDQIDRLHPYLTVHETAEFAWRCRTGGTHRRPYFGTGPEVDALIAQLDEKLVTVHKILDILGLARVQDTFVGDASTVRGVSGGEKKRVTVAEMLVMTAPVLCCDEISTGLDAATTFDITRTLAAATRLTESIKIVSLLQPPPETVANFDELILLCEGKIIYFGPVEEVVGYFNSLGYVIPERMDVADWLQAVPTKEGWIYLEGVDANAPDPALKTQHLTPEQFRERFHASDLGKSLMDVVQGPTDMEARDMIQQMAQVKFHNTTYQSLKLVMQRELLLFWRDKPAIKAKIMQNTIMGVIVGTLFFQSDSPQDLVGVIFQSMFFSAIGAMTLVVTQFPARSIFYKQQDARFFPTWTVCIVWIFLEWAAHLSHSQWHRFLRVLFCRGAVCCGTEFRRDTLWIDRCRVLWIAGLLFGRPSAQRRRSHRGELLRFLGHSLYGLLDIGIVFQHLFRLCSDHQFGASADGGHGNHARLVLWLYGATRCHSGLLHLDLLDQLLRLVVPRLDCQ